MAEPFSTCDRMTRGPYEKKDGVLACRDEWSTRALGTPCRSLAAGNTQKITAVPLKKQFGDLLYDGSELQRRQIAGQCVPVSSDRSVQVCATQPDSGGIDLFAADRRVSGRQRVVVQSERNRRTPLSAQQPLVSCQLPENASGMRGESLQRGPRVRGRRARRKVRAGL